MKTNAKDKRKPHDGATPVLRFGSICRPKKFLKSSSTSNLGSVAAEEDISVMLDWCRSLGFESYSDTAGATEAELAMHCPAHLRG